MKLHCYKVHKTKNAQLLMKPDLSEVTYFLILDSLHFLKKFYSFDTEKLS